MFIKFNVKTSDIFGTNKNVYIQVNFFLNRSFDNKIFFIKVLIETNQNKELLN